MRYEEGQRVYVTLNGSKIIATVVEVYAAENAIKYMVRLLDNSTLMVEERNIEGGI